MNGDDWRAVRDSGWRIHLADRAGAKPFVLVGSAERERVEFIIVNDRRRVELVFAARPHILRRLEAEDPEGFKLKTAERLLEVVEDLSVAGVEKVGLDVGSLQKLDGVCSELRVATLFARLDAKVRLLRDEEFGRDAWTPDLLVTRDDLRLLVEVCSGSPGDPDVTLPLRLAHLERVAPGSSDEIRVGTSRFRYGPSPLEYGYAGGSMTDVHLVRDAKHRAKFLSDIEAKAKKRARLPAAELTTPFIVAFDNREPDLMPETVLSALTG